MKKVKFLTMASIMTLAACMTSCSSDDNNDVNPNPGTDTE